MAKKIEAKTIKLSTLKPNERNPRKISEAAFERLCKSIRRDPRFMELRPIIVDEKNVIIGGNQRYRACLKLGRRVVPASWVYVVKGLTEDQRRRFILLDNSPEGMAGYWDFTILQADYEMPELEDIGFLFPQKIDFEKEWQGMPEFVQPEKKDWYKALTVYFFKAADYEKFAKMIKRKLTKDTKYIWFPKRDQDQLNRDYEYAVKDKS